MKPVKKQILFKPFPPKETTESGLFIPDSVKTVNNKGTIVDIGNEVTKVAIGEVGFRVKGWGQEVLVNNEQHFLMEESAILCKI